MKILLLSHKFFPDVGGIESISEILATEFASAGHQVRVLTWSEDSKVNPFPFLIIRHPTVKTIFELCRWADVVFENNPSFRLSWPALLLRKPTVIALHTWIGNPDRQLTVFERLKRLNLKTAKAVIAVSNVLREGIFPKAIVIPNPFKIELFSTDNHFQRTKDFVFLGRLVSDKGVDLAIDLINCLNKEKVEVSLTVIGAGPELGSLKEQVSALNLTGQVNFTGSLTGNELVNELRQHKYLLIPSKWREPFGIVALEGMAAGCIPIVADGGGLPDAVGNAGVIFKRSSLEDLTQKTLKLLKDREWQTTLQKAAPTHIAAHKPPIIAKRYLEVLSKAYSPTSKEASQGN